MDQFLLGFTKCPQCQKFSINANPAFGFPENQIQNWQCPYCFLILEGENWKKNIIQELGDDDEKNQNKMLFGKILTHLREEISPQKAKEIATEYIKNLNIKKFPPILEEAKILDYKEEWQVDFKKNLPKGVIVIPDVYCIIVNKKSGQATEISIK
jgi:hypothetical protein